MTYPTSPSKFVHPYMKLEVLFDDKGEMKWYRGIVNEVHLYGKSYVDCDITYSDGENIKNARFHDGDHTITMDTSFISDYAWRFTPSINAIVSTIISSTPERFAAQTRINSHKDNKNKRKVLYAFLIVPALITGVGIAYHSMNSTQNGFISQLSNIAWGFMEFVISMKDSYIQKIFINLDNLKD